MPGRKFCGRVPGELSLGKEEVVAAFQLRLTLYGTRWGKRGRAEAERNRSTGSIQKSPETQSFEPLQFYRSSENPENMDAV
jgi:hypothetical protein